MAKATLVKPAAPNVSLTLTPAEAIVLKELLGSAGRIITTHPFETAVNAMYDALDDVNVPFIVSDGFAVSTVVDEEGAAKELEEKLRTWT